MTITSITPTKMTKASTTSPIMTNAERHSRLGYSLFFVALLACGLYVAFIAGPAVRASAQERLDLAIASFSLAPMS